MDQQVSSANYAISNTKTTNLHRNEATSDSESHETPTPFDNDISREKLALVDHNLDENLEIQNSDQLKNQQNKLKNDEAEDQNSLHSSNSGEVELNSPAKVETQQVISNPDSQSSSFTHLENEKSPAPEIPETESQNAEIIAAKIINDSVEQAVNNAVNAVTENTAVTDEGKIASINNTKAVSSRKNSAASDHSAKNQQVNQDSSHNN